MFRHIKLRQRLDLFPWQLSDISPTRHVSNSVSLLKVRVTRSNDFAHGAAGHRLAKRVGLDISRDTAHPAAHVGIDR